MKFSLVLVAFLFSTGFATGRKNKNFGGKKGKTTSTAPTTTEPTTTEPTTAEPTTAEPATAEPTTNGIEVLDSGEQADILFMREEEKLARDVYLTLFGTYNHRVFSNIAKAEQKHMNAIETLINTYNLDDPVVSDKVGVFTDRTLQGLYIDLVTEGSKSLLDALMVGALIEEIDIKDLEEAIVDSDQSDIDLVYDNLLEGSYNHLRAFVRSIERQGAQYTAQLLTQEEVDEILNN
jgi:hypothetical protein